MLPLKTSTYLLCSPQRLCIRAAMQTTQLVQQNTVIIAGINRLLLAQRLNDSLFVHPDCRSFTLSLLKRPFARHSNVNRSLFPYV